MTEARVLAIYDRVRAGLDALLAQAPAEAPREVVATSMLLASAKLMVAQIGERATAAKLRELAQHLDQSATGFN